MTRHACTRFMIGLAAMLLSSLLSSAAWAGGDFNFIYGTRSMNDDSWEPTDDQEVEGLTVDFGGKNWPVYLAVGYSESEDKGELSSFPILGSVDLDSQLSEWDVGVRKIWSVKPVRPYIGGGVAFIDTDAEVSSVLGSRSDSDSTQGLYVEGGIVWRIGQAFNLGIDGRIVEGTDVTLFDQDGDADYWQLGALIGFGWK